MSTTHMVRRATLAFIISGLAFSGAALAEGACDLERGQKTFRKCKACHTLEKDGKNRVGPNLYGVIGRTAGHKEGFKYSSAMANSGIVWSAEELDKYLTNPRAYVPRNRRIAPP